MKVILLQELINKGGEGDVVEVVRGFAVNYLFPKNLAIEATKGNLKQLEARKHNIEKREAQRLDSADKVLAALNEARIEISAKVGEEGQLFGSVTTMQIADAINTQFNLEIDRKKIEHKGAIKTVGEHVVNVAIYRDVKAAVTIVVVDENAGAEPEAVENIAVESAEGTEDAETTESTETVVAEGTIGDVIDVIDETLSDAANKLIEAVDAASTEDEATAIADAAVEVFQEVEGITDAVIAETVEQAVEAGLNEADTTEE